MSSKIAAAFLPLVDCAVLVAAHEKGFARAEGIDLELVREPSWASLRDHLNLGYVDCAHALAPLPVASALGVGHGRADTIVPFVLNRGGNAITVSHALADEIAAYASASAGRTPAALGAGLAEAVRARRSPLTLGVVFPFSSHNYDLRYWLAAAGIHPDRDVRLVTIPPPLMVDSLRAGYVDGFCVGEPWGSLAVAEGIGRLLLTKAEIFPRSAEKVLAVRASMESEPRTLDALVSCLAAAAEWADDAANRAELAALLARPQYVPVAASLIEATLAGRLRLSEEEMLDDPEFIYFHAHDANLPRAEDALWAYAQMVRWGQLAPSPQLEPRAARVFRSDIYGRALGRAQLPDAPTLTPFDGIAFLPEEIDAYLERLELHTAHVTAVAQQHG